MRKLLAGLSVFCAAGLASLWFSIPGAPLLAGVPFGGIVLDSRGGIMRLALAGDDKYRLYAPLDEIAPRVVDAVIAYEDKYFYVHPGVNFVSLLRGAFSLAGGRRLGGSTLTMQVARLRYGLRTSTLAGKLKQVWLALAIELKHSKAEILEAYFNLAPYGGNVEGIEAASRIYFHKSAAMLTFLESQALAVVPQNPVARRPGSGRDFDSARLRHVSVNAPLKAYNAADLPFRAPHLAMELLARDGGRKWRTGIEPDLQALLERSLRAFARRGRRIGLSNGAALMVRCADMQVVASAGSADYGNAAIAGAVDGTRARRSPGSALKPFIYALALDQGLIHPQTILADSPKSFGGYDPENFDHAFRGPLPAHEALKASRNLPAIALTEQLREPGLYGFLKAAGVKFPRGPEYYGLALALGGAEVTMRELASLYAMLVNSGLWRPLRLAKDEARGAAIRLLSPEAAWLTLDMLRHPDASAGGTPVYYKTGTSNGLRDAWTAGVVGDYALVVWAGNFDNRSNPYLVGAVTALPLFEEIAQSLAAMRRVEDAGKLPSSNLNLEKAEICAETGDFYKGQCEAPINSWIIPGVSPVRDSGVSRKILVDRETGKRSCRPGGAADEVWWEFWPSDMKGIFAQAGVYKPDPPEWLPQCLNGRQMDNRAKAPRILLPKRNVTYQRRRNEQGFRLPLQAAIDAAAGSVHWYAGTKYLGSARGGEVLFWDAPPGKWEIRAVDDFGTSSRQECRIMAMP